MLLSGPKVLQESLYQTETTLQPHGQLKLTCQAEGIPAHLIGKLLADLLSTGTP